jgi:hypothetical protein
MFGLSLDSDAELLHEDGFIRVAHPFVRQLDHRQRSLQLKTLQAAHRREDH